jgi:molecular chaperone DnaK
LDVTPLSLGLETIGGVMKKLIPRNTTIPVRRSDIFSTSENNQTLVEVHALQGEREMAADNKSLGRFKLTGIPPAPRGVPQIQVSYDIDANGILQVTALDKTTGREQTVTIQGASTLSESEVNEMIREAEKFAQIDRQRRERVEKRNRAQTLTTEAERKLKDVALDFGSQFAGMHRRRIEALIQELREALKRDDDRTIDRTQSDLQDALNELKREVRLQYSDEDEDDFFGSIRRTFTGDNDRESDRYERRDPYSRDPYNRDPYSRDPYNRDSGRDSYGRDSSGTGGTRPPRERSRNAPLQNDWDEDDDDWF